MKSIVFDTGPIITLTTNNLLWLLEPLKRSFGGAFYITKAVKKELVDKPLMGRKFKFEALQVWNLICNGVIEVIHNDQILQKTNQLIELANTVYKARGNWMKIVHYAEIEVLAAAMFLNAQCVVIDERTTRSMVEAPTRLKRHLENKLHTDIYVNNHNLKEFRKHVKGLEVIRSVELATIAYEMGLLNKYIAKCEESLLPNPRRTLLESVLWGAKLNGCAVSEREINKILKIEKV